MGVLQADERERNRMNASEIMTSKPVCISVDATVDDAVARMDENRIRHLPVLDGERLVGVLSDRDLLVATGWLPARVRDAFAPETRDRLVGDIVSVPAVTVAPHTHVLSVCLDLLGRRIGCLPVVKDGRLVGVVSEMDIVRLFLSRCGGGTDDPVVGEKMVTGLATVSEDTTLEHAGELMLSIGVRHAPVVGQGRLIGLISDRDIHRAAGSGRDPKARVEEVMTREVVTLKSDERLSRAAELLLRHRVSALPVVDDEFLVGMITLTDLLDHCLVTLRDPEGIAR